MEFLVRIMLQILKNEFEAQFAGTAERIKSLARSCSLSRLLVTRIYFMAIEFSSNIAKFCYGRNLGSISNQKARLNYWWFLQGQLTKFNKFCSLVIVKSQVQSNFANSNLDNLKISVI